MGSLKVDEQWNDELQAALRKDQFDCALEDRC